MTERPEIKTLAWVNEESKKDREYYDSKRERVEYTSSEFGPPEKVIKGELNDEVYFNCVMSSDASNLRRAAWSNMEALKGFGICGKVGKKVARVLASTYSTEEALKKHEARLEKRQKSEAKSARAMEFVKISTPFMAAASFFPATRLDAVVIGAFNLGIMIDRKIRERRVENQTKVVAALKIVQGAQKGK